METPWKCVGFEHFLSEKGEACTRLYGVRRYIPSQEGNTGEGFEVRRHFYKDDRVNHTPQVGQMYIPIEGRYPGSIDRIFVVGMDTGNAQ